MTDPRLDGHTDRDVLESIWRKIDGLSYMLSGAFRPPHRTPLAHPDDIADCVEAWTLR